MRQILEGSQAIAQTIKNINPDVISAYPITPQTHIVEDLAKLKADGQADYEYVRAESEFAAASIVAGASAAGVRVYTATSSQGLLLMMEVVYNIAGMRLPVVMTCANRGVSAPITIWNDQQDVMAARDAGWIMLFAENHQEAIEQHIMAYKIAETTKLPVMVNVDGFVLTHTYEGAVVPGADKIKKYLPAYKPAKGQYLDPQNPVSLGTFASPAYYMEIREDLQNDLLKSKKIIREEYEKYKKIFLGAYKKSEKAAIINNGLLEYYGPKNPQTILVSMGSLIGTIKDAADELNAKSIFSKIGVLKIKSFRPFPGEEILAILKNARHIAIIEKAVSLGSTGPLALEVKAAIQGKIHPLKKLRATNAQSFIVGLGGRDITVEMIKHIADEVRRGGDEVKFAGK